MTEMEEPGSVFEELKEIEVLQTCRRADLRETEEPGLKI